MFHFLMSKKKRQEQIEKSAEHYDGIQTYYPWVIRYLSGTIGNGHHGVFVVCRTEEPNENVLHVMRDSAWIGYNLHLAAWHRFWLNAKEGYFS